MSQNYQNPFHQNTEIEYLIPGHTKAPKVQVTAADGKVLGTVNISASGKEKVTIEAGTYYYSLVLDGRIQETKQMVLTL